jgi:RimJ/RimL family protein N-acetyltransferase/uridine kinase
MNTHREVIIHLDSLAQQASLDAIAQAIDALGRQGRSISILSKDPVARGALQQMVGLEQIISYTATGDFDRILGQSLAEKRTTKVLVVGGCKELFEAADRKKCISIGFADRGSFPDFTLTGIHSLPSVVETVDSVFLRIVRSIVDRKTVDKPLLVGINGVDTSGKTQFTMALSRYLEKCGLHTQIINVDDYHHPSEVRYSHPDPVTSYYAHAFDIERLESELLEPLARNRSFDGVLHHLDLESDAYSRAKKYSITAQTIVLIEGVLLYREPIDRYLDLRVYLEISFDEVLRRAQIRDRKIFGKDVVKRYTNKYIPVQKRYIAEVSPLSIADLVVDNEDYHRPLLTKAPGGFSADPDITLVPLGEEHLGELEAMLLEPEATAMLGVIAPPSLEDYRDAEAYALYAGETFAGIIELFRISWHNRRAELSLCVKASMRNTGIGFKAVQEILKIGFLDLGLYKIHLRVLETNRPAIRLYEKSGFTREGLCRSESLRSGAFLDQLQMSILLPEWIDRVRSL